MAERVVQIPIEIVGAGSPKVREVQQTLEVVGAGSPKVRLAQSAIEVIYPYAAPVVQPIQEFIQP